MDIWDLFFAALFREVAILAVAVIGLVLSWIRLSRVHRAAFLWSVAGFVLLGVRSLSDAYGRARNTLAGISGASREELFEQVAIWSIASYALLLLAVICLLVAVLSNRRSKLPPMA